LFVGTLVGVGDLSKRSKKNRSNNQAVGVRPMNRGIRVLTVALALVIGIGLSLGVLRWNSRSTARNFEKLIGRWQRSDGAYVLAIKTIAADGVIEASYYNPKAIHVGKAEASRDGDATKVFVELRDVNYPGSTYTLDYEPASDQLKGIYYQALQRQRFPVAFARMKY
jgi:hypothetical protein